MNRTLKYIEGDLDTKSIRYLCFKDRKLAKEVEQFCVEHKFKLRKHVIVTAENEDRSSIAQRFGYFFENEEEESLIQIKFSGEYRQDISLDNHDPRTE